MVEIYFRKENIWWCTVSELVSTVVCSSQFGVNEFRSWSFLALRKLSAVSTLFCYYYLSFIESTMSLPANTGRLCAITALVTVFWPSFSFVVHVIGFRTLIGRLELFKPLKVPCIHNDYFQGVPAVMLECRLVVRERAATVEGGFLRSGFLRFDFRIYCAFWASNFVLLFHFMFLRCCYTVVTSFDLLRPSAVPVWVVFRQCWARERNLQLLPRRQAGARRGEAQDHSR